MQFAYNDLSFHYRSAYFPNPLLLPLSVSPSISTISHSHISPAIVCFRSCACVQLYVKVPFQLDYIVYPSKQARTRKSV